jgi:hypothetical protein
MKLSEQYKRKLTELKTIEDGGTPQGLAPAFSPFDIASYITYGYISLRILTYIFGNRVLKKLGITKIDKPGLIARIRDKKGLKQAGLTNDEIRDIWIKSKRAITHADRSAIDMIFNNVKNGKITAKQAMIELKDLVPPGRKNVNYEKLKQLEINASIDKETAKAKKDAAKKLKKDSKQAAKASKQAAETIPQPSQQNQYPYYNYTTTITGTKPTTLTAPLKPKPTPTPSSTTTPKIKTGIRVTDPRTKITVTYPNITKDQYQELSPQQLAILKNNPEFSKPQIISFNNKKR